MHNVVLHDRPRPATGHFPILGLYDIPSAATRGDGRGARRPRFDRRLADRRRKITLLSGAGRRASGIAVVVSPLISLMKDQVDTLVGNGVPAALFNSSLTSTQKSEVMAGLRQGRYRLLYVSPERLVGEGSDSFLSMLSSIDVSFVAVDEAHCISQWGHDFRPEYRQLGRLRQLLPGVSLHAYTATATARVRRDIATQLGLDNPIEFVGSFDRPNLIYRALPRATLKKQLIDVLARHRREAGIVYCTSRREVDALAAWLSEIGHHRASLSRRTLGRRAQPPSGRVPQRASRHHRRDRGLRDGHRSLGRAVRRARGRTAIARALSAGIGTRRSRRARSRVPADLLAGRLHEMAGDARAERRAQRRQPRAASPDGALRVGRRLPPPSSVRVFRRSVREGWMRRLRLLPQRARTCGRACRARPQDPLVRRARRSALRRHACRERAARTGERAGRRSRARSAQHVRPAPQCRRTQKCAATSNSSSARSCCSNPTACTRLSRSRGRGSSC